MSDISNSVYLISNAHLDPAWIWRWEEGMSAALATFRSAADLCAELPSLIFHHNESWLYEWVERADPALFQKIQGLVRQGKWEIWGGWYLQPDCNLLSGESYTRHIRRGRDYFLNNFGAFPKVAMNVDSFGHDRGIAQVLARSGQDLYLVCRPQQKFLPLESQVFRWEGCDGSRVLVSRLEDRYASRLGQAGAKVRRILERLPATSNSAAVPRDVMPFPIMWGLGNHGGGPSRTDYRDLEAIRRENGSFEISHGRISQYREGLLGRTNRFAVLRKDLNPWGPGCYLSQAAVKRIHRRLENELVSSEMMAAHQALARRSPIDWKRISYAEEKLLQLQFHDVLPGSGIAEVEEYGLQLGYAGLESLSEIRFSAFLQTAHTPRRLIPAHDIWIGAYNPDSFAREEMIEVEYNLIDQDHSDRECSARVFTEDGRELACQHIQESSSISLNWRRRVVFPASLPPSSFSWFHIAPYFHGRKKWISSAHSSSPEQDFEDLTASEEKRPGLTDAELPYPTLPRRQKAPEPWASSRPASCQGDQIIVRSRKARLVIDRDTGAIASYQSGGKQILARGSAALQVLHDNADPWSTQTDRFDQMKGQFALLSPEAAADFAGLAKPAFPAVSIIEDGHLFTEIESLLGYHCSRALIRYRFYKTDGRLEVRIRLEWNEKDTMARFVLHPAWRMKQSRLLGQVAYGVDEKPMDGRESPMLQWIGLEGDGRHLTVANSRSQACAIHGTCLSLGLVRSPAYAAYPLARRRLVREDAFTPRMDQGVHEFTFWLSGGSGRVDLASAGRSAHLLNSPAYALASSPLPGQKVALPLVRCNDEAVYATAFRPFGERKERWLLRLFNPTAQKRRAVFELPLLRVKKSTVFGPFACKTFLLSASGRTVVETNMVGEPLKS